VNNSTCKNLYLDVSSDVSFEFSTGLALVAILLCTYNGSRFLTEQLESIESQTHKNWFVVASDDSSTDQTLQILHEFQAKWPSGRLIIRSGPQKGFCQNFLSLACDNHIRADYYAFCDQDDVWLTTKLSMALQNISQNELTDEPYLYCGRTKYAHENLKLCGLSPLFVFPPSFRNALVQSIAGGNTMVFNFASKILIEKAGLLNVPSHDWWIYQLISGAGGQVYYDQTPYILYRQHNGALVGGNNTFTAKLERVWMLLQGRFKNWNTQNVTALKKANNLLLKSNQESLRTFETLRGANLKDRFRMLQIGGYYRQTRKGTLSLFLALLINKI